MTIRIIEFDPHTASDELWAAFNETRRVIAHEFWPDEPILDDAETRREVQTTNPMVEFRRWVAMEGDKVAGSIRAAFRRPGTPDEKDYARFLWAGGGVRASSRRRGAGTLLLREVHQLMHALDKTVLTMSAQTELGHAFIKHVGAVEKHTPKGVQVALLFLFFHKRLCGPLANSRFHHCPDTHHKPASKLEAAYHRADKAIQQIVDLLAA